MRKDPTEFRQRFAAWKSGELVYKDGLPAYKDGKDPWGNSTDFITRYEGFRDTAYQNKGDVPTIGYGTTNKKWTSRGKITKEEALLAMSEDLAANELLLRKNVKNYDRLPDSAKIVLRDILYNVGQGNLFNKSPKFMKALNSGDWKGAAALMDWDNNKADMGGAKIRNAARQLLFLRDLANNPVKPVSQFVESLEGTTLFLPVQIKVPVDNTDFSLRNASLRSPAPRSINAWVGADSPAYGGASLRMPGLQEYMLTNNIMPRYKDGKLPGYYTGTDPEFNMGPKKKMTPGIIEKTRKNTPHEQPLSGTDPIAESYVKTVAGMKGAQLLGEYLTTLRLKRMGDTYRNMRKYDSDIENYTGRNLRPQNIRFADEAARNQFLSRPENPIVAIGDFLAQGYTKLQGHPIIGPLIPF